MRVTKERSAHQPSAAETDKSYEAPAMVEAGEARELIRGPMLDTYWDCIGNGKTLTRPNC